MKTILTSLLIMYCCALEAQQSNSKVKGATPITSSAASPIGILSSNPNATTRAIVVGISNYQNEQIPDLRFADRDAEVFAEFLQSQAGGELDNNKLVLLTNEQATSGKLAAAFDWLLTESKQGDNAIIYFSGHGDVEGKIFSQPGFLLCWDSPPQSYMAGGTFSLYFLQEIIKTLSIERQVKTILITDACRSGKLSGSNIGGSNLTNQHLSQQFANEIKILSCQPDEYSIEGEQWGGGRGAFSYHLVNGLYGMADANEDMLVNLLEIGRYLEDNVTKEVAPLNQLPTTVGNRTEVLTNVVLELLAQVRKSNEHLPSIQPTNQKGLEVFIASIDSGLQETYRLFEKALKNKNFLPVISSGSAVSCADSYYRILASAPELNKWNASIQRNYVAALQDDAQQVINKILSEDILEISKAYIEKIEEYKNFPRLLERAAELIGPSHYMYNSIKARQFLFEGYLYFLQYWYSDLPETGRTVLEKLNKSLQYEPNNPLTYFYLSECFATKIGNPDSTYYYALKAMEYSDTWILPSTFASYRLTRYFKQFDKAKALLDMAMAIDSNHYYYWNAKGAWYFYQNNFPEASDAYHKAAELDSQNYLPYYNLGTTKHKEGKLNEAKEAYLESIRLKPVQYSAYFNLGHLYESQKRFIESEKMYLIAIENQPQRPQVRQRLADLYLEEGKFPEAEEQLLKIIEINPAEPNFVVWYNLACFATIHNEPNQATVFLEKAIQKGATYSDIKDDEDLKPLFQFASFKEMLNKYFPDEIKK